MENIASSKVISSFVKKRNKTDEGKKVNQIIKNILKSTVWSFHTIIGRNMSNMMVFNFFNPMQS